MTDLIAFLLTLLALGTLVLSASFLRKKETLSPELARKLVHIFMGGICISFPWVFEQTVSVQLLALLAVVSLLLLRSSKLKSSAGSALFSVKRTSIGELLFPIAVAWLFTLGKDKPLLYLISLLMLTFADAFGALVGTKYGKRRYQTLEGSKTIEGSLTFFIISFLCCIIPLHFFSDYSFSHLLILALTVSFIATYLEGLASHGLDNILIPIAVYLILDFYLHQPEFALWLRISILITVSFLLLITRQINTFDGAAAMGCILFGFAAFTMGGTPCFLSCLALYARHLYTSQKHRLQSQVTHSVDILFWITIVPVIWLTLGRSNILSYEIAQIGFIVSLSAITGMLVAGTSRDLDASAISLWKAFAMIATILLPAFLIIPFSAQLWLVYTIISAVFSVSIYGLRPHLKSELSYWITLSGLSLLHSCLTYFYS